MIAFSAAHPAWSKAGLGKMVCRGCGKTLAAAKCECGSKSRPRYQGLIVHDFRRSAARQLRRAGVAESVVMAIGNWKTAARLQTLRDRR